ncbi:MAG TPA: M36 family metallopeptidase [Actinomycetota bacterium]
MIVAATVAMIALLFVPVPGTSVAQSEVSVNEAIDIAFDHVQGSPGDLGVTPEDVAELEVASAYRSQHNRVVHVNLRQFHEGDPVGNSHVTVNVAGDGTVLFVGHNLESVSEDEGDVALDALAAVRAAADALGLEPDGLRIVSRRGGVFGDAVVSRGGISDAPIPAALVWEPTEDGLRMAWDLVIDDATTASLWNVAVDAVTGELLRQDDWTDHDTLAGLTSAVARTQVSSGDPTFLEPNNPVNEGSSYRVFQAPTESPNDYDRRLVENPAEETASPFGWHDTDGAMGPEFTITRGNNVHAYTDHDNSNDPDESKTVVTVDPPSSAAGEYAAVQANFGPDIPMGGISGDIELGDDGTGPNVNDGCEPYTVTAGAIALVDRGQCNFTVKVLNGQNGGAAAVIVANNLPTPPFGMGGNDPAITIPSVMISMDDGTTIKGGLPATGSMEVIPLPNPSAPDGGPGLDFDYPIDLTTEHPHDYWDAAVTNLYYMNNVIHDVMFGYGFDEVAGNFQVTNYTGEGNGGDDVRAEAQDGGGQNNANFATPAMDGGRPRMQMYLWTLGTPVRDGDFENGIIIHEYGHGISNRLVGGPTVNCITGQERMGEGWSDYFAISMLIDPTLDDPDGPRGMGPYALFQNSRQDAGIRPRPYSRDMTIQPFTYDRVKTNGWITGGSLAMPHGVGHAWAATLWDLTWNLIDRHGFNPNIYDDWSTGGNNLAIQLVTDGLKFQGCGPGFVVGRDAIIAADQALTGGENECIIWASFARRGLGFSAVQGTTDRNDNTEAFDTHPACAADGTGFSPPVSNTALNTFDAGETVPLMFNIGGDRGPNPLASNSPASQEIDCTTRTALQYAITTNTDSTSGKLTYNKNLQRYHYNWATSADWAGTCRQVIITLDDGTQLRADFRFE